MKQHILLSDRCILASFIHMKISVIGFNLLQYHVIEYSPMQTTGTIILCSATFSCKELLFDICGTTHVVYRLSMSLCERRAQIFAYIGV
jgi:hypothetical protein